MTRRCRDFPGPSEPVIATSRGWVPLDESHAGRLAASGMLLACSPEHVEKLHQRQNSMLPPAPTEAHQPRASL
jgi:hypothetical protein